MNRKTISAIGAVVIAAGVFFSTQSTPSFRDASFANAEPNPNDIRLDPTTTYGNLPLEKSGTFEDPIIVRGYGATVNCILIKGSYIVLQDVVVKNCDTFGIRVNGSHVQILNTDVSDVVRMNLIKATGKCNDSDAASWHSAIRAAEATDILIKGNKVSRSCGEGISVLRADGVTVENNVVWDTFSVNIYTDQGSNVVIRDNYSYSTGDVNFYKAGKVARGISIGAESYAGWAFNVHDILIEGNTLERVRGINFIQEQSGTPSNVVVRDNVFVNVPAPLVALGTWATVSESFTATPGAGTSVPTVTPSRTPTSSRTATFPTPSRTPTKTLVPTVVPTICETAVSDSYWFMGCTK